MLAQLLHHFFRVDSGRVKLVTCDLLSPYVYEGAIRGIPIIQSFY